MSNIPQNPRFVQKRPIINSTSGFILRSILMNKRDKGGYDVPLLLKYIKRTCSNSILIPRSEFKNPEELVREYGEFFFDDLNLGDQLRVADEYLREVTKAKREERYFTRNLDDLHRKFGRDGTKMLQALSQFLEKHGYKITVPRDKSFDMFRDEDIERFVIHQTDLYSEGDEPGRRF